MDVIYSFSDAFYRNTPRDYEVEPISNAQAKPKHHQQSHQKETLSKSHCVFCKEQKKEQKKRPLKTAIKRCANRTDSICEEPEEK